MGIFSEYSLLDGVGTGGGKEGILSCKFRAACNSSVKQIVGSAADIPIPGNSSRYQIVYCDAAGSHTLRVSCFPLTVPLQYWPSDHELM
jgi:hypothetical protein